MRSAHGRDTGVIAFLVLGIVGLVAYAQSGPVVVNPWAYQFCWNGKKADNVTPETNPVSVISTVDTTVNAAVPLPAPSGTTGCPVGSQLYTIGGNAATKGPHTITVSLQTVAGVSPPSAPFGFVVDSPPSAVTTVSVHQ